MTEGTLFVLGAHDPEMEAIEALLRRCGARYVYAESAPGVRVHPGNAYRSSVPAEIPAGTLVYLVECARSPEQPVRGQMSGAPTAELVPDWGYWTEIRIDHHRAGDPGFGRPPEDFWAASSIGQACAVLGSHAPPEWDRRFAARENAYWHDSPREGYITQIPLELLMVAAADHCLGAAYAGKCPGVDPDALMSFRAAERARLQGRPVEDVLADIADTQAALQHAAPVLLDDDEHLVVSDMRREAPWPELPEAATRLGIGYMSGPLESPDGRKKFTCSGSSAQVTAWMRHWAPKAGLIDIYGDPARGFAGGFAP